MINIIIIIIISHHLMSFLATARTWMGAQQKRLQGLCWKLLRGLSRRRKAFWTLLSYSFEGLWWRQEGFPGDSDGKESAGKAGDSGSIPGTERSPGQGMATTPVFLPEEFHGKRSLAGYTVCGVAKNWAWLSNWYLWRRVADALLTLIYLEHQPDCFQQKQICQLHLQWPTTGLHLICPQSQRVLNKLNELNSLLLVLRSSIFLFQYLLALFVHRDPVFSCLEIFKSTLII